MRKLCFKFTNVSREQKNHFLKTAHKLEDIEDKNPGILDNFSFFNPHYFQCVHNDLTAKLLPDPKGSMRWRVFDRVDFTVQELIYREEDIASVVFYMVGNDDAL